MWWIYRGAQASQIRSSEIETEIKYVERVTFHPNYSYAQFVGTYKPVQDNDDKKQIKYEYVPGPFMRMYCSAKKNPNNDFLLIIEEINRANVAAVFGDVFQLLDRKKGVSEYPVAASEDVRNYLADNGINDKELCIPNNMYIWATMNSADQGVFPMDTAFKRRWEFEYIGIDENEDGIKVYDIPLQKNTDGSHEWIKWNDLRHSINNKLTEMKINEDKLLGPYFISEEKLKLVEGKNEENAAEFVKSFKSKVLMYLFEDAVKMRPGDFFDESAIGRLRFSDICQKFDEIGQDIFNFKK
jgi:5-methylcytosine-specific restriction endonuclease McrBC GTP-binding regulatory subunit McrB